MIGSVSYKNSGGFEENLGWFGARGNEHNGTRFLQMWMGLFWTDLRT